MKDSEYNNEVLYSVLKGLITGFLIAYLIILGLRPAALYPDNMLDIIDNPWIFIILFIINFYVIQWDLTIGLLLFLSIIALILDIIIFTEGKIFYSIEDNKEGFKENNDNKVSPSLPAAPQTSQQTSQQASPQTVSGKAISLIFNKYKDINDIILNKIKEYTDKNYNKNTSVNVYIR
jgi:ABC-type multidrug transport system fused ATPase/permease subunit